MNSEKMTLKTDVTTKVVQNSKKVKKSATFKATKKAGHLLSEPGFDPHSTPQFRDLSSNFAKQNSTP